MSFYNLDGSNLSYQLNNPIYENFNVIDKGNLNDLWFHANNISSCHVVGLIPDKISNKDKKYWEVGWGLSERLRAEGNRSYNWQVRPNKQRTGHDDEFDKRLKGSYNQRRC